MVNLVTPVAEGKLPGVHALVIGVGRYPHLKGGSGERFSLHGGMKQLSSPHHSAIAFKDWLLHDMQLPGSPLRSLRVLSSSPNTTVQSSYDEPTIGAIRTAAKAWLADCNRHEENICLFYFCGHGIEHGGVTALLAQDFGEDEDSPFTHSFEPSLLVDAALAYKASRQLFLIDACRSSPAAIRQTFKRVSPAVLIEPKMHENSGKTKQAELRASDVAAKAYGVPNAPSLFMKALLASMRGAGSMQSLTSGNWVVGTASLRVGVDLLVRREYGDEKQRVVFGSLSSDFEIHEVAGTPVVPVSVRTNPLDELQNVQLSTSCGKSRLAPSPRPWEVDVDMGIRTFFAGDASNPMKHQVAEPITPPHRVVTIECGDEQ